jgi:hypothetical protein
MAVQRPGLIRWFWYALGGLLDHRFAPWVLYDLTTKSWRWRHALRTFIRTIPAFLFLLLPNSASILAMLMLMLGAHYIAQSLAEETRRTRLRKHGFSEDEVDEALQRGKHTIG